jgi:hypothetical protein
MLDLEDIFGPDGPLARALPDFKVRREQLRMAEGVSAALSARESLLRLAPARAKPLPIWSRRCFRARAC